jgi:hypothetical protein
MIHTKSRILSANGSLLVSAKLKVEQKFRTSDMLLLLLLLLHIKNSSTNVANFSMIC